MEFVLTGGRGSKVPKFKQTSYVHGPFDIVQKGLVFE